MAKPDKFQTKQVNLQESTNTQIKKAFNDNINNLAFFIAASSQRNTNYNKTLSKQFTENKRKLRNELNELINNSTEKARTFADDKNTSFLNDVEEKIN